MKQRDFRREHRFAAGEQESGVDDASGFDGGADIGASGGSIDKSAKEQLRTVVERIERLEEEKAALAGDIKDIYAEAKANGFDTKALRKIISLRKKDASERQTEEAILATYMHALGMLE
nr:DUF2312 domain-containing protein [Rhodomicrobium vannielii]